MLVRKLLGLAFASALSGTLLAVVVPVRSVAAEPECVCNDSGDGESACLLDQTGCGTGDDKCFLTCS